jgi:anti-sigma B factor antagonist
MNQLDSPARTSNIARPAVEHLGEVTVLTLRDRRIDIENVEDFKALLEEFLQDGQQVLLDMGQVQFVDSAGCAALLVMSKRYQSAGALLRLCRLTRSLRALFELVRLHRVLPIHINRDEALKLLAQ